MRAPHAEVRGSTVSRSLVEKCCNWIRLRFESWRRPAASGIEATSLASRRPSPEPAPEAPQTSASDASSSALLDTPAASAATVPPPPSAAAQPDPLSGRANIADNNHQVSDRIRDLIEQTRNLAGDPALSKEDRDQWHQTTNQLIATQAGLTTRDAPSAHSSHMPWLPVMLIWFGSILTGASLFLRIWGVLYGVVYGTVPVRSIEGVLVAGVIALLAGLIARRINKRKAAAETLSQALAMVASLVAVIALTGIFVPQVAQAANDPDCPGARSHAVAFTVSAGIPDGVNARSAPELTSAPVARYPANCVVGFDGFCIGEPITDSAYAGEKFVKRTDARWLRVARHRDNPFMHFLAKWLSGESDEDSYVAAGVMKAQPRAELTRSKFDCQESDPRVDDFSLNIPEAVGIVEGTAAIRQDRPDTQFSIYIAGPIMRGKQYRQVPPTMDHVMQWDARVTGGSLTEGSSLVVVSAVPCLGPGIPPVPKILEEASKTQVVELMKDGHVVPSKNSRPAAFDLSEAAIEACRAIE